MTYYCRTCPRIIEEDDIDQCPDCLKKRRPQATAGPSILDTAKQIMERRAYAKQHGTHWSTDRDEAHRVAEALLRAVVLISDRVSGRDADVIQTLMALDKMRTFLADLEREMP